MLAKGLAGAMLRNVWSPNVFTYLLKYHANSLVVIRLHTLNIGRRCVQTLGRQSIFATLCLIVLDDEIFTRHCS